MEYDWNKIYDLVEAGDLSVIDLFPNFPDVIRADEHQTLLRAAICNNRLKMVVLLLHFGADPNHLDDGFTPLMSAIDSEVQSACDNGTLVTGEIISCLLLAGANPLLGDRFGQNAFEMAVARGHDEAVELFNCFLN